MHFIILDKWTQEAKNAIISYLICVIHKSAYFLQGNWRVKLLNNNKLWIFLHFKNSRAIFLQFINKIYIGSSGSKICQTQQILQEDLKFYCVADHRRPTTLWFQVNICIAHLSPQTIVFMKIKAFLFLTLFCSLWISVSRFLFIFFLAFGFQC